MTLEDLESVSAEAVIEGVRKAAAMHPERVYAAPVNPLVIRDTVKALPTGWMTVIMNPMTGRCEYHEDRFGMGQGHGCIIGESLYGLGLDPAGRDAQEASAFLHEEFALLMTQDQSYWLDRVQKYQDMSLPWATAVERADADLTSYQEDRGVY